MQGSTPSSFGAPWLPDCHRLANAVKHHAAAPAELFVLLLRCHEPVGASVISWLTSQRRLATSASYDTLLELFGLQSL